MPTGVYKTANKARRGFTLMEILVVITMMAILATLIVNSFVGTLRKGRDSRRKQDIQQMAKALELYYADHNKYPLTLDLTANEALTSTDLTPTRLYMKQIPSDPVKSGSYTYLYESEPATTSPQWYRIYTCLENTEDIDYQSYTGKNCGSSCTTCNYGIASPNTTL